MSFDKTIEHVIELPGTPEQVWQAIATGPGVTAWWIPTKVEERVGGTVELDFGPGMGTVQGVVTVWEPPTRFAYQASDGAGNNQLAYEWRVEAGSGDTCTMRMVTSGFLTEADWQKEYDSTFEGWKLFFTNLRLYVTHFAGQRCSPMVAHRLSDEPHASAWQRIADSLGLPQAPSAGDQVAVQSGPPLAGTVERFHKSLLTLRVEEPARGIGFVGAEAFGDKAFPMIYLYLFGPGADEAIARDEPAWNAWLERTFAAAAPPA